MKDPLVTFVEVIGLAATGLEAEWGRKTGQEVLNIQFI